MLCLWSAVPRIAMSFGGMHLNRSHSSCGNLFDLPSEVVISRPQIHRAHHSPHNFGATYDGGDPLDIIGPYWTQTPRCRQIASPWSSACSRQPRRQGDGLRWARICGPKATQILAMLSYMYLPGLTHTSAMYHVELQTHCWCVSITRVSKSVPLKPG